MPIIVATKDQNIDWARWNLYPDQFVSAAEKRTDTWIKSNMDYFANVAYSQFIKGKDTFVNNYNLVKGILRPHDFYIEDDKEMRSFTENLLAEVELPAYVKHYSILGPPLNTLVGEQSRRPDIAMVKAFDEDSKNEELQFKTDFLQKYIMENGLNKMKAKLAMNGKGQMPEESEITKMTLDEVGEYLDSYTSVAERWASRKLEGMKVEFNMKEISEDCFRDLLICSREFFHIFERSSKTGLDVENLNPKNVWYLTLPDKKYIHKDAFAAGTVHVMELSEIIERFDLEKKEIDHLRKGVRELSLFSPRESNFENPTVSGWDSIKYDTYSPYLIQERLRAESKLKENTDPLNDFLGLSSNVNTFGNKYVVVQAYWKGKIKVGKLTFRDENGDIQEMLVDESYKKIPNEVSIEWSYQNQWFKGLKIGPDVYHIEPYELLDYCPIIGVVHEIKNIDEGKSLVDMLKPYQVIYNICLNQLYKLLEKEVGNVYLTSIRHIPIPKDGDAQDALDIWEEDARKRGVVFIDDSPENLKSPSNFNMFKNVDLTRTQEIQSRYNLAQQMKMEAWELVGITRERTGGIAATQTATGTNAALSQSYAQTEPLFAQHEYVLNDVYQAMIDAAQYLECKKPWTTLSYLSTEGEQIFMKVNSEDIKMRDLKVFITSRAKDQQLFQELKSLAQPMLQNGATPYEIAVLYSTNSVRQMKRIFKDLKDKMEQIQQAELQMKQEDLKQKQAQFEYQMQREDIKDQNDKLFEAEQNELDRLAEREKALIMTSAKGKGEEGIPHGTVDTNELSRLSQEREFRERDYQLKKQKLDQESSHNLEYIRMELEKIAVERERLQAQLKMKQQDIKARKQRESKSKT